MKRKSTRRFATVFLSLFLVCICISTVIAVPASAATASQKDEFKNDYTTTDPKPTYTETLNKNNELLGKLSKEENAVLKKIKTVDKEWVSEGFALLDSIRESSEETDWEKVGVEVTKKVIVAIAGIWGLGGLAGSILDGIELLTSSGQAPLSEVQVLSDDIDQHFHAISDQLYDIEDQLGALSNQVTSTANDVLSGTQSQINNLEAKQILRSFMTSGEGNFSYLEYSNYLYGNDSSYVNASEAYYILLLESIQSGASDEVIEYYYNQLFDSLYSNIHIYNQYYYGEIAGLDKSMAAYYYDYLSYNPDLIKDGTTAEYQALLFALDLYTTYVYSYEILEMCFAYQATNMYLDASLENRKVTGNDDYEYANGKRITYSVIENELAVMQANLARAEEQAAADIAYILGMKDSYIVVGENQDVHSIGNYGASFGNVAEGQTVYMNVVPDEVLRLFLMDADDFRYYVNGVEYLGEDKGVIRCDNVHSDEFSASVRYGNTELYSIEFTNIDRINQDPRYESIYEFSGGSGTPDDPYLISNAVQFNMVKNDLNACYQLISDITVTGVHSPIGTEKKPFNGTFDGNGYSISNLTVESLPYDSTNITMTPTTGMFGTVGRTGVVKDLTLQALKITSDYQKDHITPENDVSYYCVGGIAGMNKGLIRNCTVTDTSSIVVHRMKKGEDSRTVEVYVGGIVGSNDGIVEYCSTGLLSVQGDSYLYYYNESTSKNQHALYMGGIAGVTSNIIRYCRVSNKTSLSAYAKSIADSEDREKPILTVYVGGITADDSAKDLLSQVYSDCTVVQCKGEIYNDGTYWGEHRYSWNKVSVKEGVYYPTFFPLSVSDKLDSYEMRYYESDYEKVYDTNYEKKLDDTYKKEGRNYLTEAEKQAVIDQSKIEVKTSLRKEQSEAFADSLAVLTGKILSDYADPAFTPSDDELDIRIQLTDSICDINAEYLDLYFNKLIDRENEIKNIQFVDEKGNKVRGTVVAHYGFDSYHEFSTAQTVTVKVFFYVDDTLMCDDVAVVVKAKELVDWKIEDFIDTDFEKGISSSECLDKIFQHGFKLVYTYSNGEKIEYFINDTNRSAVDIYNLNPSAYGKNTITIYHNEQPNVGKHLKFEQTIEFACNHEDFVMVDTVEADCLFMGYEIWKCRKDGVGCGAEFHRNYVAGDHTYVVKSGQKATCHEAGYTQEVFCSVCNTYFVSSEWIQALPHNYVSSSESGYKANDSYPADEYHYCTNGDHYEAHQFTVNEYVDENGTLVYLYSCFCGYENSVSDSNIITDEKGEKTLVMVTDGHVLNVGDEVVVYVQILNNPGFLGATFGIRYDDGLELLSVDESMIVPQQLSIRNEVHNGYNFLWASGDGNTTTEDGYLLKLTFRYADEAKQAQHVSVVYGMSNGSEGGFCALDETYRMFMTQSGTISVVEHLPGDVNNDDAVDIMDATYIAWSIVGKENEKGEKIRVNARYADVNLDGKVDLLDVLAILQSISGRYGRSLLSSDYQLFFDLNGFICNDMDESVMVGFYDENGTRTKWSENVDFENYEALMMKLGYTFVGWYTRMDCTCTDKCTHLVNVSDFITYDKYQGNQTLYARWEKNKIIFDMGGADCEQFDEITYSKAEHENSQVALETPAWSYDIDYIVDGAYYDNGRIYKEFLGWKDANGNYVSLIDLSKENLGVVILTAAWSEYKWIIPDKTEKGYHLITNWFADEWYKNEIDDINGDRVVDGIVDDGRKIYGKRNPIQYFITYNNLQGAANINNNTKYYVTDTFSFKNPADRIGYDFAGWVDDFGNLYTKDNSITDVFNTVGLGDINLTAKWKAKVYTITVNGVDINHSKPNDPKGNPKYYTATLETIYYTFGDESKSKGFYKQMTCTERLPANFFNQFCEDDDGKTNFTFGGLYAGVEITDNGHSYASYADNIAILSSNGKLLSDQLILSEESQAGTLYALILPKQYTITLDFNTTSQPELYITNAPTKSVKAYHNEHPDSIGILPTSEYYVPSTFFTADGKEYYSSSGTAIDYYSVGKDSTMYCKWREMLEGYYYIYDANTLKNIKTSNRNILICDIDLGGAAWTPISSFSGILEGGGHCIYNFSITKTGGKGSATFAFIQENTGIINNLTIGQSNVKAFDNQYSVKYNISYTESSSKSTLTVGGFVGNNSGTISGCKLINTMIQASLSDNDNNENLSVYVGGIAASNTGTIRVCEVQVSRLNAFAPCPSESGDNNRVWLGGISALNSKSITGCSVTNTTLQLDVRGNGFSQLFDEDNDAYPFGALGGLVGEQVSGTTSSEIVSGNTLLFYASEGKYTHPSSHKGDICGLKTSGNVW